MLATRKPGQFRRIVFFASLVPLTLLAACATDSGWHQQYALCQQQIEDRVYDTARHVCRELFSIAVRNGDLMQQAQAVSVQAQLITLYTSVDAYQYELAKARARQRPLPNAEIASIHEGLGSAIFDEKGSLSESESQLRQALTLYEAEPTEANAAERSKAFLARTLSAEGKYEEAFGLAQQVSRQDLSGRALRHSVFTWLF